MERMTSPPKSIKNMITMNWELEKSSISIVDMLETVADETDIKNKSKLLGSTELLGIIALRNKNPSKETKEK